MNVIHSFYNVHIHDLGSQNRHTRGSVRLHFLAKPCVDSKNPLCLLAFENIQGRLQTRPCYSLSHAVAELYNLPY